MNLQQSLQYLCNLLAVAVLMSGHAVADDQSRPGFVSEEFAFESAPFPSCHSATLLELDNGELLCAFFGGTAERNPDVEIWVCRKGADGKWTAPVSVADGVQSESKRMPTWNPVLFQPQGRDLFLFYKVGPSPKEWWGEFKTSQDRGQTWSKAEKLPSGILGPVKNKPIQLADGTIVSGSSTEGQGWRVHIERSTDGAKTWELIGPIHDGKEIGAIQPTLLNHSDGRIQLLCRTRSENGFVAQAWSNDGGKTWGEMTATNLPNNNSGLDAVTLADGRHFLVYNHSTRDQVGMGHKGRGILNVSVSKDGRLWEAALVIDHLDQPGKQFSYPAVIQTRDGLVHLAYTWHRDRIKHVVLDPRKLQTIPMADGVWPVSGSASLNALHQWQKSTGNLPDSTINPADANKPTEAPE